MATPRSLLDLLPFDDAGEVVRSLLVTLAAGVFLAMAGAFGSEQLPLLPRIGYWVALIALGWLWGMLLSRLFFSKGRLALPTWARVVLTSVAMGVPYSAVVALAGWIALRQHYTWAQAPGLVGSVTLVSLVMVVINVLVDRVGPATAASDTPARFLERLPLKLRGAEIWAVEAEDHYLRLHTSKGQDLILLRLADAIAELEGIEGAQAHRSWWVARDAIVDAQRGDGRATLTLKDGAQVPVSRTYARVLRQKGWF